MSLLPLLHLFLSATQIRSYSYPPPCQSNYEIGGEIGRGCFGVVHRCTSRATGEAFAVKSVDRSQLADDLDRELAELEPKLAQLAGAGNPGVVQTHAVYEG